jgi:putative heme transporter
MGIEISPDNSSGVILKSRLVEEPQAHESVGSDLVESAAVAPLIGHKVRQRVRAGVSVLTVAAFVLLVLSKRGALTTSLGRLGHPHWTWVPIAVALEALSMATFAGMQRRLLTAGGQRVRSRPMMATIFAANALSVSVPLAGPELGAAFTFQRFKRLGADTSLASWTLIFGGLMSWVGAIVVLGVGGALSGNVVVTGAATFAALVALAAGFAVRAAVGRSQLHPLVERPVAWVIRRISPYLSHRMEDPHVAIRRWIEGLGSLRLSKSAWSEAGGLGLCNWLADAGVLAISLLAIGASVPWHSLLLVYGLAMVVGSLGITPGGVGLVEGTLCLGLVSAGLPAALALAAVLLYRLVSFWLVMATGWLVLLYLRLEPRVRALSIQGSGAQ